MALLGEEVHLGWEALLERELPPGQEPPLGHQGLHPGVEQPPGVEQLQEAGQLPEVEELQEVVVKHLDNRAQRQDTAVSPVCSLIIIISVVLIIITVQ